MDSEIDDNKNSDDNICRTRSGAQNINSADKLLLFEIIQKSRNEDIVNNTENSRSMNQKKNKAWMKISDAFNSIAVIKRSAHQLKGVYRNEIASYRKLMNDTAQNGACQAINSNLNPLFPRYLTETNCMNLCFTDGFPQDQIYKHDDNILMSDMIYSSFPTSSSSTISAVSSNPFPTSINQDDHSYSIPNVSARIMKPRYVKYKSVRQSNIAKREMFKSYAKAAVEKSKREEKESAKKIDLINEKILYYRQMRQNLQYE